MKKCKSCNKEKDLSQFRDSPKFKDKKFPWCLECQNARNKVLYHKNKTKRLKQITEWNNKHPEKLKIYKENWRNNHPNDKKADTNITNNNVG